MHDVKDSTARRKKGNAVMSSTTARQFPRPRGGGEESGAGSALGGEDLDGNLSRFQTPTVRLGQRDRVAKQQDERPPLRLSTRPVALGSEPPAKKNDAITVKVGRLAAQLRTTRRTVEAERAELAELRRATMRRNVEEPDPRPMQPAPEVDDQASWLDEPRPSGRPSSTAPACLVAPRISEAEELTGGPEARRRGKLLAFAGAVLLLGVGGFALGDLQRRAGSPSQREAPQLAMMQAKPVDSASEPMASHAAPAPSAVATPPAVLPVPSAEPHAPALAPARTPPPKEPETLDVPPPAPSKGLDRSAVSSALARLGARAMSCSDARGGDGPVSVTFLPDGTVDAVQMGGSYAGTAVAGCVEQIFRGARISPFDGMATTVHYTVHLPGDGKPIQ